VLRGRREELVRAIGDEGWASREASRRACHARAALAAAKDKLKGDRDGPRG
jgi:hypothetical protein